MLYCSTYSTRIVETENTWLIKSGETSESEASQNVEIKEVRVQVLLTNTSNSRIIISQVDEPHKNQ